MHKRRKNYYYFNFNSFKLKTLFKNYYIFISILSIKIFLYHLKLLRFFFNRLLSKTKHYSRKERFKRAKKNIDRLEKNFINKGNIFYKRFFDDFNYLKKKDKKKLRFKFFKLKKRKFKRFYIFINIYLLPYTKKSVGSRMGKGKGAVRNWYFRIKNGWPVFFFKNWNSSILRFGIRKLKIFLPGKWIFYYNDNSMLFNSSRSINRNNLWIL